MRSLDDLAHGEAAPLFRALPGLRRIHDRMSDDGLARWMALTWRYARRRFDLVLDLAARPPATRSRARRRIMRRRRRRCAIASRNGASCRRRAPLAPKLWLDDRARADAQRRCRTPRRCSCSRRAASTAKQTLAARALRRRRRAGSRAAPLAGARVVVLARRARRGHRARDRRQPGRRRRRARAIWQARSICLRRPRCSERATLCIGNDNALTHIAAAMGAPTLDAVRPHRRARARTLRPARADVARPQSSRRSWRCARRAGRGSG